jgi:hypothetical protein
MKLSSQLMRWPVIALAALFTVACGSSGGGGGGDIDDDVIIILPVYAYQLTSSTDDPVTVTVPLFAGGRTELQLGHLFEGPGLFGTYQPEEEAFTVERGSSLVVSQEGPLFFGDFSVQATEDWFVPGEGNPNTGTLEVTRGEERIEVAVINGGANVRIRWDAAGDGVYEESVELTWQEFEDLDDFEVPDWQPLGAFAYNATIEYVFELAELGIASFDFIDEELEQSGGQFVGQCSAISDLGLSVPPPPPIIPDQGQFTFAWLDTLPNGSVGPGDSFTWEFVYCLEDDPDDDIDDMLNGELALNDLTEVYEQRAAGETLTRIGWEGLGVAGRPGGIEFNGLEQWEVWDADGDGPETEAAAFLGSIVDGRMTLVFFEPQD